MAAGISQSARYLDRLVDAITELPRIGRNDGQPEPVDLHEVAESAAERVQAAYPELRVELGELPVVMVDRLRIEQVFDNLIGNAAKHGGRSDLTVIVSAEDLVEGFRVVVADDGAGVGDDEREAVFTLFRRGSSAGGQGSGIGLGLVRRIVEAYGGRIRFAPTSAGARAELDLPASLLIPAGTARRTGGGSAAADKQLRSGNQPS